MPNTSGSSFRTPRHSHRQVLENPYAREAKEPRNELAIKQIAVEEVLTSEKWLSQMRLSFGARLSLRPAGRLTAEVIGKYAAVEEALTSQKLLSQLRLFFRRDVRSRKQLAIMLLLRKV